MKSSGKLYDGYAVYALIGENWKLVKQTRDAVVAAECAFHNHGEVREILCLQIKQAVVYPILDRYELEALFVAKKAIKVKFDRPRKTRSKIMILNGKVFGLPIGHTTVLAGRFGERKDSEHFIFHMPENGDVHKDLHHARGPARHLRNGLKVVRVTRLKETRTLIIRLPDGVFEFPGDGSAVTFIEKPVIAYPGPY